MNALENDLKELIIEALDLEDITPSDIDSETPLFDENGGIGLDSIDALELGIAIQKKYAIQVDADDAETRAHFASVRQLAAFVQSQRTSK